MKKMTSLIRAFHHFLNRFYIFKSEQFLSDWHDGLISLYLVRTMDGICLYSHHFQIGPISQIETQLVGMGFTALTRMMREIVDSNARINTIDLKEKMVLIEDRENLLSVLIVNKEIPVFRKKLIELTTSFEKMFEIQLQISETNFVCPDDFALTSNLVSMIFSSENSRVLDLVPIIFDSIRKNNIKDLLSSSEVRKKRDHDENKVYFDQNDSVTSLPTMKNNSS